MKCDNCGFVNPPEADRCASCGADLDPGADLHRTQPLEPTQAGYTRRSFPSKYEIIRKIKQGGMGEVYQATDKRLRRTVALKFLSVGLMSDPRARKQFITEARAASALDHPNICTIYEVDETEDNQLYISMAYYRGETLRERLNRGPLEIKEILDILIPVATGLSRAHAERIIHHDIKPSNIFITDDGQIKILDFGLAKLTTESGEVSVGPVGTVLYMSPEQIQGERVDAGADIWSLGVVIYEMTSGKTPFTGRNAADVMNSIVNDDPTPLGGIRKAVPAGLERIVMRAIVKKPALRYRTIEDLLADLDAVRKDLDAQKHDLMSSIAVLPFADMSLKKDQEYFCEGIAEELIHSLAQISTLRVASRTSSFKFGGSDVDIRDIGRQLNVETMLEGSVRKSGDNLRITAQLLNVADGYHLWSGRYDREVKDVFSIQDEIAQNIVEALEVTLTPEERQSIHAPPTTDVQAYDYYLRGRKFYYEFNRKGIERALQMFTLAIKHDPGYALAYAGIADCCAFLFLYADRSKASLERANEASLKALNLNPKLAEAHASRGQVLSLSQKHDEAEAEFKAAIKLGPRLFEAYYLYARDCFAQGKFEQAVALYEKASQVNPDDYQSPLLMAQIYDDVGQQPKAATVRRRGIRIIEEQLRLNPGNVRALYLGANGLMALGEAEKGLEWASLALTMDPTEPMVLYNVACIYSMAGRIEDALDCLEKAARAGLSQKEWYEHDSNLDPLRSRPRFRALLKELG
jgi:serine/threonine protein kinase/Tfp pilus assembly protein PilF